MSKKSVIVLILLLAIEICTISASDVMISWNWEDLEYAPLYSRYQLDGTSTDGWIQLDGDKNKVYFEVDTSVEHNFYIETTYDGWVWSKPSVILIPKKTNSFSAKLELGKVDFDLLFEENKVSIDLTQAMDEDNLKDFFVYFANKIKLDGSEFDLIFDSNKVIIEASDSFDKSDVSLLKMLFNSVYEEWKTTKVTSKDEVETAITTVDPLPQVLETEIVENGCSFVMTVKDDKVTITCEKGFSFSAFQSLSQYMSKNLKLEGKGFTYSSTSDSVVFSYPRVFNAMDFEEIKNTIQPLFHAWYVEYNKVEIDEKPVVEEAINIPSDDLKPEIKTLSPDFQTEIVVNGCTFVLKVKDNTAVITCDKGFSLPAFQSLYKYMLENLDLEEKDFIYSFTSDVIEITYPEYFNQKNFEDIVDTIKPIFNAWYEEYNEIDSETLPVLLAREFQLGDYTVSLVVNTETIQITSNKAVSKDVLDSLTGYMVDTFKLEAADFPYTLFENSMIITYPSYLKTMDLAEIEKQVTPALYTWYNKYNNKEVALDISPEPEKETVEKPTNEIIPEKEEFMGTVDNLEVSTIKNLNNTKCLSLFYVSSFVHDWDIHSLDQSIGIDFSQNFFKGGNRLGLGYVVGLTYDPTATLLTSNPADTYLGIKTGIDVSYAFGKDRNFFLSGELGVIGAWRKTDILNMNFVSPVLGAFVGGGLKFAINDSIMIGLKVNLNRYF